MKKIILSVAIALALLIGGGSAVYYVNNLNSSKVTWENHSLTYKGQDGKTALELLQKAAKIVESGTGENAFVTSINGTAANPKNQYWEFDVNGKAATAGAGSYTTKSTETITWKIASF